MRCFVMFVTPVCILFLLKLNWPKNKSLYDKVTRAAKYENHSFDAPKAKLALVQNFSYENEFDLHETEANDNLEMTC